MKKILKRYKPKLFRKKLLEECDTMIYRIEDGEDIKFVIDCLKWVNLEEPKQLVVISNVLSWGG
jgi:adenylate kinase